MITQLLYGVPIRRSAIAESLNKTPYEAFLGAFHHHCGLLDITKTAET